MKRVLVVISYICILCGIAVAQEQLPVRGLCIGAPSPKLLPYFINFINDELAPRKLNTLILRIEYNYQFESQPELSSSHALSKKEVKRIVDACRKHSIRLIPAINLLGHQSWAENVNILLRTYPEFDETPHIKMPDKHSWPNNDGLYCKSYCPLHPDIHKVIFNVIDEICEVFESDAFHAGMDEVFYIGHDSCIRCGGKDKAELFAGEVNRIYNHLSQNNRQLWIWGDRLIDGKATGMGMWEASMNNTHRAIDLINKNIIICDWHYEKAHPTAVYFAMKGFGVVSCPWKMSDIAITQYRNILQYRESTSPEMKNRFLGIIQTIWTSPEAFLDEMKDTNDSNPNTQWKCFNALFEEINNYNEHQ